MPNCEYIDSCHKIKMVLGKELIDGQYLEIIERICKRCPDKKNKEFKKEVKA